MLSIDALKEYGADVDAALVRCMGNEAFYLRLVKMALSDVHYQQLLDALDAGDIHDAFEHAHALKGVLGNLELTPVLTPVVEITEVLRHGNTPDPQLPEQIKDAWERPKALSE